MGLRPIPFFCVLIPSLLVAFFVSLWLGRIIGTYGFYYADVPIFADMGTLMRKNLLTHILKRPGASQLPDSPGEAISRFKGDVQEIPIFVIMINDVTVGLIIIAVSIVLMTQISPSVTFMALIPLVIVGIFCANPGEYLPFSQ